MGKRLSKCYLNKHLYLYITIVVIVSYFICEKLFLQKKPEDYQMTFNSNRKELNLPIIPKNWKHKHSLNAVYQKWYNPNCKVPCYWIKYINCDTKFKKVASEIDIYLIEYDNEKKIVSIKYNYDNQNSDWQCYIKKYNPNYTETELFGYPSEIIKAISLDDADSILKKVGLQRLNYANI